MTALQIRRIVVLSALGVVGLGAVALTVRNCRFEDVGVGVWTESADSRDFVISDNLFLGREDQMRLIGWNQAGSRAAGIYPSHQLRCFFAVKVY